MHHLEAYIKQIWNHILLNIYIIWKTESVRTEKYFDQIKVTVAEIKITQPQRFLAVLYIARFKTQNRHALTSGVNAHLGEYITILVGSVG